MAPTNPGIIEQDGAQENLDDFTNSLLTMENLDRSSPEMWPEKVPGVTDFINSYNTQLPSYKMPYSKELTADDQNYMQQLAALSSANLIAKIKEMHDIAYQLGVEEAKEVTRGKYLNMFDRKNSDK